MLPSSLLTSIFAVSCPNSWQFAAIAGVFSYLGQLGDTNDAIRFKPQINSDRDYRHICGGKLEGINVKLYLGRGRCILASTVPK
ncbi:hypothetical protein [Hydrococcus rivularis]|uniref:hypothetical protein n=1 Tax=Hydrococcus rivularis TaxID=1616834 RepID=UPI000A4AFB80|nr:hypothetical protein [Hydrococcus rivularis]